MGSTKGLKLKGVKRYSVTLLAGLLGVAVLVGLNVLVHGANWRWDATVNKRHSLAPESVQVLEKLDRPVMAAAFYRPQDPGREVARELFELITARTDEFSYEFVDPDRSPFKAREYDVAQVGTVVLVSGDKRENVLLPDEEKLVNGVIRVTDPKPAKVLFLTGHGELRPEARSKGPDGKGSPDSCAVFAKALRSQGIGVDTLLLAQQRELPPELADGGGAVAIFGPQKDFLEYELDLLGQYVEKGGRLIVALEPESSTNLEGFLADHFRIERRPGFVVDPVGRMVLGDPMAPLVRDYEAHPITRDFDLMTLYPTCGALGIGGAGLAGGTPTPLGRSTSEAWLETDVEGLRRGHAGFDAGRDAKGPVWLSMAWEGPQDKAASGGENAQDASGAVRDKDHPRAPRVVVFADQDFISDRYVTLSGNLDLARNSVQWVLEREGLITVSKPKSANVFLLLTPVQRMVLTWLPLLLLPGGALALGVIVALRRRRANG